MKVILSFKTNIVNSILREIDYVKNQLKFWMKPVLIPKITMTEDIFSSSYIHKEPYGAVLIIGPWNYPFSLIFRPLIGAIAGGNVSCIKPSEISEHSSKLIFEIISKTFEKNEVVCVQGAEKETVELLSEKWDYIFFTGGTGIGKKIMSAASVNLTPVTLELGGKSPVIIDESANLSVAAKRIIFGKFMNVGQSCTAPDHIWIQKRHKEAFIKELKYYINEFYSNPKESKEYSRIINTSHTKRLINIIENEKSNIIYGGSYDEKEKYIEPTILDNITTDSFCMKSEIFGPIIPLLEYDHLKQIIPVLQKEKPLVLYLFSERDELTDFIAQRTSSGAILVNDTMSHAHLLELPFGGVGESGIGKYHGKKSFETFTHEKSIYARDTSFLNDASIRYPPFSPEKINTIEKLDVSVATVQFSLVAIPIIGFFCYKIFQSYMENKKK